MEFIPYTQALELKELGFNEPCWAWYNIPDEDVRYCYSEGRSPITNIQEEWDAKIDNRPIENIGLPTFSQAFTFFREKYQLLHSITEYNKDGSLIIKIYHNKIVVLENMTNFDITEYEEAELVCLEKLIEIIKENGK